MTPRKLTRRKFISMLGVGSAALFASQLLSACVPSEHTAVEHETSALDLMESDTPDVTGGKPDIEIALEAIQDQVQIHTGKSTSVWRYVGKVLNGPPDALRTLPDSYLGPIFQVAKGQTVRVHFANKLPEQSIVHWHGLHVPEEADGHPRLAIGPGGTYVYNFTVADRAGTYWYHPHPHGRTGSQVYKGLAGLFLITDEEEQALGLPGGEFDIPLVIQDRYFDNANQLVYDNSHMSAVTGFMGNQILVNGQSDYTHQVPAHAHRLRVLNGSNARIYTLSWEDGSPLTVIGTDGGLLEKPLQRDFVTLGPAQRVELWVDFNRWLAKGEVKLVNRPSAAPDSEQGYTIMTFKVSASDVSSLILPETLTAIYHHEERDAVNYRSPRDFYLVMGKGTTWTINGKTFEMTAVDENEIVKLNDVEVWRFINQPGNSMGMMGGISLPHPMHIHGLQFQVIDRQVDKAYRGTWSSLTDGYIDQGWHDTVLLMPGEQVKVLMKYEDFTGLYLYHCHNLEHEDMGMMRNYRVVA